MLLYHLTSILTIIRLLDQLSPFLPSTLKLPRRPDRNILIFLTDLWILMAATDSSQSSWAKGDSPSMSFNFFQHTTSFQQLHHVKSYMDRSYFSYWHDGLPPPPYNLNVVVVMQLCPNFTTLATNGLDIQYSMNSLDKGCGYKTSSRNDLQNRIFLGEINFQSFPSPNLRAS